MVREDRLLLATYDNRVEDTQAKIDEDPSWITVYRGRTRQLIGKYKVRIVVSNNIPNAYRTAASESLTNDATILAMPGTDMRTGDRVVDQLKQNYLVRFVPPGQEWGIEAQVTIDAGVATAP